jgi:hypothetical protein
MQMLKQAVSCKAHPLNESSKHAKLHSIKAVYTSGECLEATQQRAASLMQCPALYKKTTTLLALGTLNCTIQAQRKWVLSMTQHSC